MDSPASIPLEDMTQEELIERLKADREKLTTANKELKMGIKDMKKRILRETNEKNLQMKVIE